MTPLIADHPYLACALALALGAVLGWFARAVAPGLFEETAAGDRDDITGIGA